MEKITQWHPGVKNHGHTQFSEFFLPFGCQIVPFKNLARNSKPLKTQRKFSTK